jgi:hypothetical protein
VGSRAGCQEGCEAQGGVGFYRQMSDFQPLISPACAPAIMAERCPNAVEPGLLFATVMKKPQGPTIIVETRREKPACQLIHEMGVVTPESRRSRTLDSGRRSFTNPSG